MQRTIDKLNEYRQKHNVDWTKGQPPAGLPLAFVSAFITYEVIGQDDTQIKASATGDNWFDDCVMDIGDVKRYIPKVGECVTQP